VIAADESANPKRRKPNHEKHEVHENQRVEAGGDFIIRVKSSTAAKHLHFVLFCAFRGFRFGMKANFFNA
jgi:hypothetical protein